MEGNPDQQIGGSPEEGERLKINTIIIPADNELAMRLDEIGASHLPDYQAVTGGLIERVGLDNPPSSLYFNEEGKLLELPLNRRATLLLWMHNPAFRYQDLIVGDALLVGPADREGYDTNVPDALAATLFETKRFRTEVQVHGEGGWHGNDLRFDNWVNAYSYVLDLERRWTQVQDVRVVPEE
jgi:hypothetical protein